MTEHLHTLVTRGVITHAERHALNRLITLSGTPVPDDVAHALALAFRSLRVGDVCVNLPDHGFDALDFSAFAPLVTTPGAPDTAPFLCDGDRLYLTRQYHQEQAVGAALQALANRIIDVDDTWLQSRLTDLFGAPSQQNVDRQRLATAISMTRGLSVIAGGPGSGKTFTVSKILTLLHAWHEPHATEPLNIVLAAPTGRAAARLTQTLHDADVPVKTPAMTLHRLLFAWLNRAAPKDDMLDADVVIVDEASMVGLPLFATLLHAMKPSARLILLGDSNQLGAIDTGAVFHELCGPDDADTLAVSPDAAARYAALTQEPVHASTTTPGVSDVVVRLNVTHRFVEDGGVGTAARILRDTSRDPADTVAALKAIHPDGFMLTQTGAADAKTRVMRDAVSAYSAAAAAVIDDDNAQRALELFDEFRLLCAIHDGPFGTRSINQQILAGLAETNRNFDATDRFAVGRFVLVTRNDANAGVQNGDVGVVVGRDGTTHRDVVFPSGATALTRVSPYRLDAPDDPYAMSVHKAQGSQFDTVVLLLPDSDTPVATRALVYTAVTRAQSRAVILDPNAGLTHALGRIDTRTSGLRSTLFGRETGGDTDTLAATD